jgi:TRAP-type uncharacterized transport system substrate-binding protein
VVADWANSLRGASVIAFVPRVCGWREYCDGQSNRVPFWIFSSGQSLDSLTQLKGKRIAVGPEGSGARYDAERILGRANIDAKTATLLPLAGDAAVEALNNGTADAALLVGGSDAPSTITQTSKANGK